MAWPASRSRWLGLLVGMAFMVSLNLRMGRSNPGHHSEASDGSLARQLSGALAEIAQLKESLRVAEGNISRTAGKVMAIENFVEEHQKEATLAEQEEEDGYGTTNEKPDNVTYTSLDPDIIDHSNPNNWKDEQTLLNFGAPRNSEIVMVRNDSHGAGAAVSSWIFIPWQVSNLKISSLRVCKLCCAIMIMSANDIPAAETARETWGSKCETFKAYKSPIVSDNVTAKFPWIDSMDASELLRNLTRGMDAHTPPVVQWLTHAMAAPTMTRMITQMARGAVLMDDSTYLHLVLTLFYLATHKEGCDHHILARHDTYVIPAQLCPAAEQIVMGPKPMLPRRTQFTFESAGAPEPLMFFNHALKKVIEATWKCFKLVPGKPDLTVGKESYFECDKEVATVSAMQRSDSGTIVYNHAEPDYGWARGSRLVGPLRLALFYSVPVSMMRRMHRGLYPGDVAPELSTAAAQLALLAPPQSFSVKLQVLNKHASADDWMRAGASNKARQLMVAADHRLRFYMPFRLTVWNPATIAELEGRAEEAKRSLENLKKKRTRETVAELERRAQKVVLQEQVDSLTAELQAKTVSCRLLCFTYTTSNEHDVVTLMYHSWARKCDAFLAFTNETKGRLGELQKSQPWLQAYPSMDRQPDNHGYHNQVTRERAVLKLLHTNHSGKYDWVLHMDPDGFVIVENVKRILVQRPLDSPQYVGRSALEGDANAYGEFEFIAGGGGSILNANAVEKMYPHLDTKVCGAGWISYKWDVLLGRCLKSLGVFPSLVDDIEGKHFFHFMNPKAISLREGVRTISHLTAVFHYCDPVWQERLARVVYGTSPMIEMEQAGLLSPSSKLYGMLRNASIMGPSVP